MAVTFILLFYLNFVIFQYVLADERSLSGEFDTEHQKNGRNSRSFIYANADTFFHKNKIIPFYTPVHKVNNINSPIYNTPPAASYQLLQLNDGWQAFPYMIPISENINQVIDSMYQNKGHGSKQPEGQRDRDEIAVLCEGRRAQIPSPWSCSGFINCWDGIAVEQECTKGLLFSERGFCDYSHRVDCGRRPLMLKKPSCMDEFSTYRNPADCSRFSVCVHGEPVEFQCPANLHYNEILGVCDYRYKVHCNMSAIGLDSASTPPPSDPTTTAASVQAAPAVAGEATPVATAHLNRFGEGRELLTGHGLEPYDINARMTPYVASSREDAMRQIKYGRRLVRGNRMGDVYYNIHSPYGI